MDRKSLRQTDIHGGAPEPSEDGAFLADAQSVTPEAPTSKSRSNPGVSNSVQLFVRKSVCRRPSAAQKTADKIVANREVHRELTQTPEMKAQKATRDKIVMDHKPMIRNLAASLKVSTASEIDIDDLVQVGIIAVLAAYDEWEPAKGAFSTYAMHVCTSRMYREIMDYHTQMRIGTNAMDKRVFFRVRKLVNAAKQRGEDPFSEEAINQMAAEIGVSPTTVERMLPRIYRNDLSIDETTPSERDSPSVGDREPWWALKFGFIQEHTPERDSISRDREEKAAKIVHQILKELPERQQDVILQRWLTDQKLPFSAIAAQYGHSKKWARDQQQMAFEAFREQLKVLGVTVEDLADETSQATRRQYAS